MALCIELKGWKNGKREARKNRGKKKVRKKKKKK